jgi:(p)ppGpp synthase/HD superfamily hydrolase
MSVNEPGWKKRDETAAIRDLMRAASFAAQRHCHQRRKGQSAEPYVNHLLEVAELVSGALTEPDVDLVIAALLHDTIEDTDVTKSELAERFGADVADLVSEVTDDKSLPKQERKRLQIANAPHKSIRAQVIKLADKTSNLRAILASPPADWDLQRQQEYCAWARQVVDGLTSPNAMLLAEFDRTHQKFIEISGDRSCH